MNKILYCFALLTCFIFLSIGCGKSSVPNDDISNADDVIQKGWHENVKRIGMVIKIKPDKLDEYLVLHADTTAGVRGLLQKYNVRNFSIFMVQLEDGNYYEFGYYEYWGDNFEEDTAKLSEEPRNQEWLELCDPMQIPLEGETSWKEMRRIYFNY
jgi:L-rhamnose mutarotase